MYSIKAHDGKSYGPADLPTIERWVSEGRIFANTTLIDHVTDTEGPAGNFPIIASFFDAPMQRPQFPSVTPYGQGAGYQPRTMPPTPNPYANPPANLYANNYTGGYPISGYGAPPKQKLVAALLAFFLGFLGIHQFYLGKTGLGIAMLLITVLSMGGLTVITAIWSLVDFVMILTGTTRDSVGRALA